MTPANLSDQNRAIYEKLAAVRLPIPVSNTEEPPAPTETIMARFHALTWLVRREQFVEFLAFMREESLRVMNRVEAKSATEEELRWAKAGHEYVMALADTVMSFIQQTEDLLELRSKWLEQAAHNQQTAATETSL